MSTRFRYALVVSLLAAAACVSVWLRQRPVAKPVETGPAPIHAYHVDVAGWYAATPDEVVIYGRYDLALDAVTASLPMELDVWSATDLGTDEDIEIWFEKPDLVLRRRYTAPQEPTVWLTAIGSRGAKSFHIFEHTPTVCYPSAGWSALEQDIFRVHLSQGTMPVNREVFVKNGTPRIVYSWYQWDGSARDAAQGVTTWRLTTDAPETIAQADSRLEEFLGLVYLQSIPYRRF